MASDLQFLAPLAGLEPATCCLGDNCQSSVLYGSVGSSQVRLGGVSGESGLVRFSCGLWNDRENDQQCKLRRVQEERMGVDLNVGLLVSAEVRRSLCDVDFGHGFWNACEAVGGGGVAAVAEPRIWDNGHPN
jgi:hypothetical protein